MTANSDMTIRDVRVMMLRLPWADGPWLKGAALGAAGPLERLWKLPE